MNATAPISAVYLTAQSQTFFLDEAERKINLMYDDNSGWPKKYHLASERFNEVSAPDNDQQSSHDKLMQLANEAMTNMISEIYQPKSSDQK